MRTYCKMIVEKANGEWSARFRDVPDVVIRGAWPLDAVHQLLTHFGKHQFDTDEIVVLDGNVREDHREFMIALRDDRRIPILSAWNFHSRQATSHTYTVPAGVSAAPIEPPH